MGVRFYSGYASSGERVTLQREPYNQHDQNAIKVLSVMGAQIGHIPRNMASDLAKYMVIQTNETLQFAAANQNLGCQKSSH